MPDWNIWGTELSIACGAKQEKSRTFSFIGKIGPNCDLHVGWTPFLDMKETELVTPEQIQVTGDRPVLFYDTDASQLVVRGPSLR